MQTSNSYTKQNLKLSVMQPYFFPYIGYFHLVAATNMFIVYDNIKYTKKGWINRNRILKNGKDVVFTLPLKNGSDSLNVCERILSTEFDRHKLLNQFKCTYCRAPHFTETFKLIEEILLYEDVNLFGFLHNSIVKTCEHLCINTEIRVSSDIAIDHSLKNQDKVIALCEAVSAKTYVNPIGGLELYSKEAFSKKGVDLKFVQSKPFVYPQFGGDFVPWLSIVDVMMFNSIETIQKQLFEFDLL